MIAASLLALVASATAPTASGESAPASAPQILCQIEMPNWCLTHSGTIDMSDQGGTRKWSLQDRIFMREGPLVIIESEACRSRNPLAPRFLRRTVVGQNNERRFNSVEYQITEDGCTLEFRWPVLTKEDRSYEQYMLFGVLIGDANKTMQLYRLSKPMEAD